MPVFTTWLSNLYLIFESNSNSYSSYLLSLCSEEQLEKIHNTYPNYNPKYKRKIHILDDKKYNRVDVFPSLCGKFFSSPPNFINRPSLDKNGKWFSNKICYSCCDIYERRLIRSKNKSNNII